MAQPFRRILDFFKTGPDLPPFSEDPEKIRPAYEKKRWSVFISLTIGYGMFYVCRTNFSMSKKSMLDDGILTADQMGMVGTAMLLAYSVGKLVNGFLADRANVRRLMSTFLLISAAVNILLGCIWFLKPYLGAGAGAVSTCTWAGWARANGIFLVFMLGMGLNGWFQSGGAGPSITSISHWFSKAERGTRYGIWSTSHGFGQFFTFAVTGCMIAAGGWSWGFWGPGLMSMAFAMVMFFTLADRPQTYGLPSIAQYKNEPPEVASHETASIGALQMEVIKSPGIWVLAIATGCLYIGRYGIEHWAPLFLQTAKGHSAGTAGWIISSYSIGGVFGLAGSGFISEHLFRGNRYIPMLVFDIVAVLMIAALYLISAEHVVTQAIILALIGFTLCATMVYKSGLMAVDLVSRRAAGAAIGLVGLFSYVAAAIQDTVTGRLLEHSKVVVGKATQYSYHGVFAFWITSLCISTLLVVALGVYTVLRKKKMTPA